MFIFPFFLQEEEEERGVNKTDVLTLSECSLTVLPTLKSITD